MILNKIKMIDGLINVRDIDDSIIIDLRYATENNFLNKKIYDIPVCVLQLNTALKLSKANSFAKDLGYRLKVLDAYRPLSVQKIMWDIIKNEDFVAPYWRGSNHNRGAAVDVTLTFENGDEILMPSDYDEFSERASINYKDAPTIAIENRELLSMIMIKAGFLRIESEWWHFNDSEYEKYGLYDISLEKFI
ncbi:D-alanyl-D-alanine dipeptidase [Caloramator quimbayensis]|uniref:D-alanyl-D-alanine dipeptidase n=1 Tax=Caloramator quimbayensis TaxID=1147123 RepID=A0A1T4X518_9CLOT|nr:M15 family metallopeptidase [Caloramator quimbayensis]SKA84714.1 D-alanyl-D-alanine dipeptidase [Caloramator quimbayensis]